MYLGEKFLSTGVHQMISS